jgi:hypothetical protein
MALKFSKEKKDPKQRLINFGFKSLLGPMGNAAVNYAKEQLVKNIHPIGYHAPVERIKSALLNKNRSGGIEDDEYYGENIKERRDLLSMMLLNKQQHNTIPVSKYRPTNSKDKNSVYYSSPTTEENIRGRIASEGIENILNQFTPNKSGVPTWVGYGEDGSGSRNKNVLGNYTMQLGEDEEGKYMSYYDKWDLNPYNSASQKNKVLDAITTGAQYAAGVKPTELYGRIYYEPKVKSSISGLEIKEEN